MKMLARFLAALALLAAPLPAAITVSVDMDPATPGIQGTRVAAAGQVITVDLVLGVGAEGVSSYGISAQFDNAELALNGSPATTVPALPGGLTALSTPAENNALGRVYLMNGGTLGNGPASTSFIISSISFTAAAPTTDANADISLGFFNTGVDGCYDNTGNAVVPTFVSGKVDLVPLVVTSIADSGAGSLRVILASAAAKSGPDTITFDPALSGQTITLGSEIVVSDAGGVTLDAGSLPGGVTIHGGAGTNRIFSIVSGTTLNLVGLTLTGGNGTGAAVSGYGGAIENQGTLSLTRCTVSGNSASSGAGAIDNFNGTLMLTHCTLSSNSTSGNGGAFYNFGTLTLTHCTLSGNFATGNGGGVYVSVGKTLVLNNSIVAGNSLTGAGTGADIRNDGTLTRVGANIVQSLAGAAASGSGTINNASPLLAALGSYGGPTQTMALLPGSPARNAAAGSLATSDQRGFPIVATPDIGAYEAGTFTDYQAWIWETLQPTTASHAAGADVDGDTVTNHNEWLALTDPGNPASYHRITQIVRNGANLDVTFPTVLGRTYSLEYSTDLANWTNLGPGTGTGNPLTIAIGPVTGFPKFFVRIRVGP